MSDKRKDKGIPYDPAPDIHHFHGIPNSSFDIINMYGTYEVQRTADTENEFPRIAQGTPKAEKDKVITKDDLEGEH